MDWEDRRQSTNLEDRRRAQPESNIVIDGLSLLAVGAGAMARSVGVISEAEELQQDLSKAQADLDDAMSAVRNQDGTGNALPAMREQAQHLVVLQRALTDGGRDVSASLKQAIASAITRTAAVVTESRETLAAADAGRSVLVASTEAARREVEALSRDVYDRRIFDPYLSFASAEDEAEYRRREAENKRYIDAELAKGTPEGALNASGGMQDQMLDAAAHGADQSPEFKERWEALRKTAREQREALQAEGKSTEEYDKRVEDSVRRFLRSKGLTEAEIDEKIKAAGDDPLAAAEPYLEGEKDARALDQDLEKANRQSEDVSAKPETQVSPSAETKDAAAGSVFAEFQSTGVRFTGEGSGHGLNGGSLRDRGSPALPT